MKLKELLKDFGIECVEDREILDVTNDINKVNLDSVFVAIQGSKFDSHIYLEKASSLGAYTISNYGMGGHCEVMDTREIYAPLVLAFHKNPQQHFSMIGITGTNGKSSVGYYVYSGLRLLGYSTCFISTDGIYINEDLFPTINTTPSIEVLVDILKKCTIDGVTHIVMEVSSHSLSQYRLHGIAFDIFVYTNLGHDHLDYHGSFMDYFEAKKRGLFYVKEDGYVVLSSDEWIGTLTPFITVPYSIVDTGEFEWIEEGCLLRWKEYSFKLPLFSKFQIDNSMLALEVLRRYGTDQEIASIFPKLPSMPGRMECIYQGDCMVFVDYAHTVEAYETLGKEFNRFMGEKWIVFGLGGDRDVFKRPWIGSIVEKYFDKVVLTTDNSRTENAIDICRMIESGMQNPAICILNRYEAINYAISNVSKHGIIIIAGKGNESFMKIGNEVVPFNDSEVIYQCLVKRGFIHAI